MLYSGIMRDARNQNNELPSACARETEAILANRDWRLVEVRASFVSEVVADAEALRREAARPPELIEFIRLSIYRRYSAVL